MTEQKERKRIIKPSYLIIIAGLVTGLIAALLQITAGVGPPNAPVAYGICIACHGRDLINWIVNVIGGTNLGYGTLVAGVPVLTVVGIVAGAFISSTKNKEFKFRTTKNPGVSFVCGFAVMASALILGACPLRAVLRVAYGDAIAVVGFIAISVGVVISSAVIKVNARRAINREVT